MAKENLHDGERRRLPRKKANSYFEVRNHENNDLIGMLVDLNVKGMRIYSEKSLDSGQYYKLRINLPKPVMNQTQIVFGAVIIWCRKEENTDCWYTGFEFRNLSQIDRELIEKVTAGSKFKELKKEYNIIKD